VVAALVAAHGPSILRSRYLGVGGGGRAKRGSLLQTLYRAPASMARFYGKTGTLTGASISGELQYQ